MNLIQKIHALMVSDEINIWHFELKKSGPKFYYWLVKEEENELGHGYYTLDGMIEAAYKHIDPAEKKLPDQIEIPDWANDLGDD